MLIGFYVSNWKSILDTVEFSMEATREQQHSERLTRLNKFQKRVLPTALMFGANASGKSSFVQALGFMQRFVTNWEAGFLRSKLKPYAFWADNSVKHSTFEIDLYLDGYTYNYSFACDKSKVVEEQLSRRNSRSTYMLFHRTGNNVEFSDKRADKREKMRRQIIVEAMPDDKLFLTHSLDLKLEDYRVVYDWFKNALSIIGPQTVFSRLSMFTSTEVLELYNEVLPKLDAGIKRVELEEISKAEIPVDEEELDEIISFINKQDGGEVLLVMMNEYIFITVEEVEDPKYMRLVSIHNDSEGNECKLPFAEESDGTRRAIEIIPAFCKKKSCDKGRTYVIDEIDRSLHTHLTKYLFENFFSRRSEGSRDQIIATTHDQGLITQELFRRDEMWIFERDASGTKLISFAEYEEARSDLDLQKSYREGRLGGLPYLG